MCIRDRKRILVDFSNACQTDTDQGLSNWTKWCQKNPSTIYLPTGGSVECDRGVEQGAPLGPVQCAVVISVIMEHIEEARLHSGDSTCTLPPYSLSEKIIEDIKKQTKKLAIALKVKGLLNIQFAIQNNNIFLLEVNPRSSRTVPFVAKSTGLQIVQLASKIAVGKKIKDLNIKQKKMSYIAIKELSLIHI